MSFQNFPTQIPAPPDRVPIGYDTQGRPITLSDIWYRYFLTLLQRTGGASGSGTVADQLSILGIANESDFQQEDLLQTLATQTPQDPTEELIQVLAAHTPQDPFPDLIQALAVHTPQDPLALSGVTAGTYLPATITVDIYGRITSISVPTYARTTGHLAAPTGTTSSTGVMVGLGAVITPAVTGNITMTISGNMTNDTAGGNTLATMCYGTGTPPINGAALPGGATAVPSTQDFTAASANAFTPFSISWSVNLTVGTAWWVDLQQKDTGGVTLASLTDLVWTLWEAP